MIGSRELFFVLSANKNAFVGSLIKFLVLSAKNYIIICAQGQKLVRELINILSLAPGIYCWVLRAKKNDALGAQD